MRIIKNFKWTLFFFVSLILFFVFANSPFVLSVIDYLKNLGYLGASIAGFFFASIFTVVPATYVLFKLSLEYNLVWVVIWSTVGETLCDYFILRFFKNGVFEEVKPLFASWGSKIQALKQSKYLRFLVPFLGAIIILSPFPDEIGIALMGLSHLKNWQFIILSFVLNGLGMYFILKFAFVIS